MVYEVFSVSTHRMIERLKQFLSPTWNVKVLVIHQYLHEWLLLNYNHMYLKTVNWKCLKFFMQYVLCHFVENAQNSCAQARLGLINGEDGNAYQDKTVDLIAQEALTEGLLSKLADRKKSAKALKPR